MPDDLMQVALQLDAGPDADEQEVAQLTIRLRRQLLELDIQSVDRVRSGEAPQGTRAAEVLALGGLLVTMAKSTAALKPVLGVIQSVVAARPGRSVELVIDGDTIKVTDPTSQEQQRLIE